MLEKIAHERGKIKGMMDPGPAVEPQGAQG
jgi:hypothetical protein